MAIEILVTFLISFSLGLFVNKPEANKVKVEQATPDRWPPNSQVDMIKACGIVCGKNAVKSYDSLRGECHCK